MTKVLCGLMSLLKTWPAFRKSFIRSSEPFCARAAISWGVPTRMLDCAMTAQRSCITLVFCSLVALFEKLNCSRTAASRGATRDVALRALQRVLACASWQRVPACASWQRVATCAACAFL